MCLDQKGLIQCRFEDLFKSDIYYVYSMHICSFLLICLSSTHNQECSWDSWATYVEEEVINRFQAPFCLSKHYAFSKCTIQLGAWVKWGGNTQHINSAGPLVMESRWPHTALLPSPSYDINIHHHAILVYLNSQNCLFIWPLLFWVTMQNYAD